MDETEWARNRIFLLGKYFFGYGGIRGIFVGELKLWSKGCSFGYNSKFEPSEGYKAFEFFWLSTSDSILNSQEFYLKRVSLDSVWACDSLYFAGIFFKEYYFEIFDKELLGQLNDKSKIYITSISTNKKYLPTDARKEIVEDDGAFMFREVEIEKTIVTMTPIKFRWSL